MAVSHLMYLNGVPPSFSPPPTRQAIIGGVIAGLAARFLFGRGLIVSNLIGAGVAYAIYKLKSADYGIVSTASEPIVITPSQPTPPNEVAVDETDTNSLFIVGTQF